MKDFSMDPNMVRPRVSKDEVTIVIPTLNEEKAIGLVIDELVELGYERDRILVVDGHSEDSTIDIVREKGVKYIYQDGIGKADAILSAVRYIDTPYMLIIDGDYTYDPRYIEEMLKKMPRYTEVIGARLINKGNISRLHRFGNKILTKIFNLVFGTSLRDLCSGIYLVRTDIVRGLVGKARGFSIEAEIAAAASHEGDITDIPIRYRERIGEKKLSSFKDGVKILWNILTLSWWYNPIFMILSLASFILIPSLIIAGYVAYEYLVYGVKHFVWAILSVAGLVSGLGSFMLSLLFLYIKRMERRLTVYLKEIGRLYRSYEKQDGEHEKR